MITLAWYFLKVIICSGILCGYYFLALRNKAFHRWNRFYLLAAIVISLLVPIMKINIFSTGEDKGTVVQVLQTISYGDEAVIEYSHNSGFQLSTENIAEGAYLLISAVFLFVFLLSIYKIKRIRKKYPETKIEDVSFINTTEKGTPFSFFKSIFWNQAIDLHSRSGQQIFNHEIAHVKEKHSYDKILMNIVLIFFWINPFFWLMRKELYMIHEFIADKEALEDSDINAFAEMILQTVYPGQHFSSTNNFFYSPIKRRILMLTKHKNPKVNYISRLLVLPLAAIVFFAFTLKVKNNNNNLYDGKTITVVIDAGHGGTDNGAVNDDGIKEKDITLSIAKKIAALNSNKDIKILLSRDNDQTIPIKERVAYAENNKADLFISIHVNASADKQLNGFSVLIDKQNSEQSLALGSSLINALKETYKTEDKIGVRKNGIFVLDQNICPAALVECGFLSNTADAAFISNSADQEKIAKNVLDAINSYFSSAKNVNTENALNISDTIPKTHKDPGLPTSNFKSSPLYVIDGKVYTNDKIETVDPKNIESINVLKGKKATEKYGDKGKNGVIEIITKYNILPNALIMIDGKESSKEELQKIPGSDIESITVLKGEGAVKKYGDKGKEGAIEITTKYKIPPNTLIVIDGKKSSKEELDKIPRADIESITILKENAFEKYGYPAPNGAIEITTKKNSTMGAAKDTMPDKVFTKVEKEAQFPGGVSAWQRYISRAIVASLDTFTEKDYGTCILKFIVNTDGKVSDVKATTMQGTQLARVSVEAIKSGPKWIPASQNDKPVAAYRLQPVTLMIPAQIIPRTKTDSAKKSSTINIPKNVEKPFIKLDRRATFPGGQSSWLKYITQVIQKNGSELIADKKSEGVCKVRFVVSKNGKVSDVEAVTKQGTQLAEVAVNAIKQGPRWTPGMQNGYAVNSYVIQPVRFVVGDQGLDVRIYPL